MNQVNAGYNSNINHKLEVLRSSFDCEPQLHEENDKDVKVFFLNQFPFLLSLLKSIEKTGLGADKLVAFYQATKGLTNAAKGLQIVGSILAGIEFLTIPAAMIECYVHNKKFPFTFSTGAKWAYSAVIFALGVAALAVPGAALTIGLVSASLALSVSVLTLGKNLWTKWNLRRQRRENKQAIAELEQQLENNRKVAQGLTSSTGNEKAIGQLFERRKVLVENLQRLTNEKSKLDKKDKALGTSQLINKCLGVAFASGGVIGLGLMFAFPLAGLAVLAITSTLACVYVGGIGLKLLWSKVKSRKKQSEKSFEAENKQQEIIDETAKVNFTHESTLDVAKALNILGDPEKHLKELEAEMQKQTALAKKITSYIDQIVIAKKPTEALRFMYKFGLRVQASKHNEQEMRLFLSSIDNFKELIPLIKHGLDDIVNGKIKVNEKQLQVLKLITPIKDYLQSQHAPHLDRLTYHQPLNIDEENNPHLH